MSTLGGNVLTLADWAKRKDPDGKTARIVEMLSQVNAILDHMMFREGNLPTGHRSVLRTGLPSVYWRLIGQGVPLSKSTTAQATDQAAMLEAWAECDKDLAELENDLAAFRLSEAAAFLEAMAQEHAGTLFYGNSSTAPEEFNGLAVRYSSLSAANAQNIIDCGGTGSDNTSMWMGVWGENTAYGIFPKGSKAGLVHTDKGLVTVENPNGVSGTRMEAYQDKFELKTGLCLKDWRFFSRACNIDVSNLVAESSAADLVKTLIKMYHRIPAFSGGTPAIYMNRTVAEFLDIQRYAAVQAGGGLSYDTVDGKVQMSFRGIPIYVCDQITEAESRVT